MEWPPRPTGIEPFSVTLADVAIAVAASGAGLARLGLIDGEAAAVMLLVIELPDGRFRFRVAAHLDEPEALGATGLAVGNHLGVTTVPNGENICSSSELPTW